LFADPSEVLISLAATGCFLTIIPASALRFPTRAFDEKVESTIVDSHDGANQIQHLHWDYGDQS
jgi:hypothetical protein